jgi:hypothetical protein
MPATKPEPRYDVFISYRRGAADALAVLLQTHLQKQGVTAFLDRDLRRGVFDDMLLRRIAESPSFLIILTPCALDRCSEQEDWLRKEIIQAISSKRNIIPLQVDSFQFTSEMVRALDPAIRDLARYQAVVNSLDYLESTVERIVKIVEEDKAERKAADEAQAAEERRLASERGEAERKAKERQIAEMAQRDFQQRLAQRKAEKAREKAEREITRTGVEGGNKQQHLRKLLWAISVMGFLAILVAGELWFLLKPQGVREPRPQPTPMKPVVTPQPTATPIPTPGQGPNRRAGTTTINDKDGLKYVWIPGGTFTMGCSVGDRECSADEKPPHQVKITEGFWLVRLR